MNFKKITYIFVCYSLITFPLFINLSYAAKRTVELAGWINDTGFMYDEGFQKFVENKEFFTEINPYWYNIGTSDYGDGTYIVDGLIYRRDAYDERIVTEAHDNDAHRTLVLPTIADGWIPDFSSGNQVEQIINNPTARQTLINNLVADAVAFNYDGWDLNFEASPTIVGNGRATFPSFIRDLALALKAEGKKLSVTIKCVKSSTDEERELFDIAALAEIEEVWRFKIMGFDNNFELGEDVPNAIADYYWLDNCLEYMLRTQGLPANKTQLGLHNFVRIWENTGGSSYIHDSVNFRSFDWLQEYNTSPYNWDYTTKESWVDFTYENSTYRAFIGDAPTVSARFPLIDKFDLVGLTFWVLEAEDDQIYQKIAARWKPSNTEGLIHQSLRH
ncbi:MAG: hypothetical protein GY710_03190 [Desulfobacteraceae bacterium]|nr:hypothetical protein [Desulfobacteraceae bacterium]